MNKLILVSDYRFVPCNLHLAAVNKGGFENNVEI